MPVLVQALGRVAGFEQIIIVVSLMPPIIQMNVLMQHLFGRALDQQTGTVDHTHIL